MTKDLETEKRLGGSTKQVISATWMCSEISSEMESSFMFLWWPHPPQPHEKKNFGSGTWNKKSIWKLRNNKKHHPKIKIKEIRLYLSKISGRFSGEQKNLASKEKVIKTIWEKLPAPFSLFFCGAAELGPQDANDKTRKYQLRMLVDFLILYFLWWVYIYIYTYIYVHMYIYIEIHVCVCVFCVHFRFDLGSRRKASRSCEPEVRKTLVDLSAIMFLFTKHPVAH